MEHKNSNLEIIVRDLNEQLEKARHAYYILAIPILTDAEYDVLEARLRGVIDNHPDLKSLATALTTVGSDVISPGTKVATTDGGTKLVEDLKAGDVVATGNSTGGRVVHLRPMLSIENQYKKEDVVAWVKSLPKDTAIDIEPKRDGISAENRFVDHHLFQGITRGTGTEGEDMTTQILALHSTPKVLHPDFPADLRVRGELAMRSSELDRINAEAIAKGQKTYSSTRNLTAGTMKQKDLNIVASREIVLLPWDMYSPTEDDKLPDSNYDRMLSLSKNSYIPYGGYFLSEKQLASTTAEYHIISTIDKVLEDNKRSDIPSDGVVIKVDSHKLRKQLGVGSKFTNYQICFKPQSSSGTTYLRKVIWQIGRTGKLTPVAECDPVVLAGALVTRATLNNETWIATMGLTIDAKVEQLRSGEVIPQIVRVIDNTGTPIIPPSICPECGSTLVVYTEPKSGITTRWCENAECSGRIRDLFTYIGSREILEIDGLADDMANRLITQKYARNLGELFKFQADAMGILGHLSTKYGDEGETRFTTEMAKNGFNVTILKMIRSMENAKKAPWNKWIAALGIPHVGRTLGKVLAKQLQLAPDDMINLPDKLEAAAGMNVENMGDVKGEILRKWSLDPVNRDICKALYEAGVRPTSTVAPIATGVGQPLAGVAFLITGTFTEERDELIKKLESLGAVSKSGVSKNLTHFIVGAEAGTSKLAKYNDLVAKGCKIQKVGKEWLETTLSAAGLGMKSNFSVEEV